jgi:type I restriction enzyme S subunit
LKDGRLDLSDVRRISRADFDDWTRKTRPKAGDVIVSRRCNPGETAYVPHGLELALGQNLVLLRADGKTVVSSFLRWLLRSPAWWEQVQRHLNVGAVFDSLKCRDIPNFRLPIPPLGEQQAIAEVLASLDERIDLNRRMSHTLEGMAHALFTSWFVEFEPVQAKAEGRLPGEMDVRTAALFPDRFEETELGPVPLGWRVTALDAIASFLNGLALQKFPAVDGQRSLPVLKISHLRAGSTNESERAAADIPLEYVVHDGDLVFSWSGSLLVRLWAGGPAALNQHLFKVSSTTFPRWFVRGWLNHHLPEFQGIAADKATTMGHIQRHHLTLAKVVIPPREVLTTCDRAIAPLEDLLVANDVERRTLAAVRDLLLPKLLSGEVRVKDAEAAVTATA